MLFGINHYRMLVIVACFLEKYFEYRSREIIYSAPDIYFHKFITRLHCHHHKILYACILAPTVADLVLVLVYKVGN